MQAMHQVGGPLVMLQPDGQSLPAPANILLHLYMLEAKSMHATG